MRVRATAMSSAESNAIGSLELECTHAGLALGLYGIGGASDGYAPGALTHGTRFTVPYNAITRALAAGDRLILELDSPTFPHSRLTLTRFTAGPGVPLEELRRRRLILHFSALSLATLACLAAAVLSPSAPSERIAWGALGYGAVAALLVMGAGYALDRNLLLRPPGEESTRQAFVADLGAYVPHLIQTDTVPKSARPPALPSFSRLIPRTVVAVGVALAAAVLTALVSGQRMLQNEAGPANRQLALQNTADDDGFAPVREEPTVRSQDTNSAPSSGSNAPTGTVDADVGQARPQAPDGADGLQIERRCMCDRADSPLWNHPIAKLSGLLIERRTLPRKTFVKTGLEVGVVNNSDTPMSEITLHVQFYEKGPDGKRRHTKERPLYFEGPLRPGEAIKWSTEARGTDFEIQVPDLGTIGVDGRGAASADSIAQLLEANHRPVRLHAARLLSYLGDPRGRVGALALRDALRAAEGPYLRRILSATSTTRVCDVEVAASSIGACVYNAGTDEQSDVGLQLLALDGSLDVSQPLANPPEITSDKKWKVPGALDPEAGRYIRVQLPSGFLPTKEHTVEVNADRFDLLD